MAAPQNREIATAPNPLVWVWDHDRRRIVWATDKALGFWGERTVLDLSERDFPPTDPATLQFAQLLHAASVNSNGQARAQLTLSPSGMPRRVEARVARFALSDGRTGLRIHALPHPTGMHGEPERMREIFATAPQAMSLFADDGGLLIQNDAANLIFGTDRLAPLAARFDTEGKARKALHATLISGAFSQADTLHTRAGLQRHRITMRRMPDPVTEGFAVLVSFSDATEREATPRLTAPAQYPQDTAHLLNAIDAGIAIYDNAMNARHLNPQARRILGLSEGEQAPALAAMFAGDSGRLRNAMLDIREGRQDSAILALAGSEHDLHLLRGEWQGATAWIATMMQRAVVPAVTATVPSGQGVALDAIGVGLATLRPDGSVVEMNAAAEDLLEWVQGNHETLTDILDEESAEALLVALRQGDKTESVTIRLKDHTQTLKVGLAPVDGPDTDHRIATFGAANQRSEAHPGIFERREAIARTSHELRTPLNAVIGFTQLMLQDPAPIKSDAYIGYLKDINDSGTYMLRLLQDLLDMRRIEADTLTVDTAPIDLGTLLRIIAREAEFMAQKRGVDVVLSIDPALPPVLADRHTIRQAVTNLVGNATKFTQANGWVRISATLRSSGAVQVEVIDNGKGMTPEELNFAMEPFGQMAGSHHNFGGAGMGLPLAKGFVEANRARFEMTSEKGLGTIARIVFPAGRVAREQR